MTHENSITEQTIDETQEEPESTEINVPEYENENERTFAAISFVLILIVLGLPLWWKMTKVERGYFPYDDIAELSVKNISFPLRISLVTQTSSTKLAEDLRQHFSSSKLFRVYIVEEKLYLQKNTSVDDLESLRDIHSISSGHIRLIELPPADLNQEITVGNHRTVYYRQGTSALTIYSFLNDVVLSAKMIHEVVKNGSSPGYMSQNIDYLRKLRPSPSYDIIFTVVQPQPEKVVFKWNNKEAVRRYFQPFIEKLSLLSHFQIKSQWLYLVDWQQTPTRTTGGFELNQKQIPHIITPLEKRIGSGVAQNPCINFVLYIISCDYIPTVFVNDQGQSSNAILSARWGGVQIVNPTETNCNGTTPLTTDARLIMQVFLSQFKSLLGLIDHSSYKEVMQGGNTIVLRDWELDILYRARILEFFISSRITLSSLSQLLGEISNIVITEEVSNSVVRAVTAAQNTLRKIENEDLESALVSSNESFISSEFAFTHPSLLALLYFPDDQKYAVYIPLYLPVMIPVFLSLKNIYAWLRKKHRKEVDAVKKED